MVPWVPLFTFRLPVSAPFTFIATREVASLSAKLMEAPMAAYLATFRPYILVRTLPLLWAFMYTFAAFRLLAFSLLVMIALFSVRFSAMATFSPAVPVLAIWPEMDRAFARLFFEVSSPAITFRVSVIWAVKVSRSRVLVFFALTST